MCGHFAIRRRLCEAPLARAGVQQIIVRVDHVVEFGDVCFGVVEQHERLDHPLECPVEALNLAVRLRVVRPTSCMLDTPRCKHVVKLGLKLAAIVRLDHTWGAAVAFKHACKRRGDGRGLFVSQRHDPRMFGKAVNNSDQEGGVAVLRAQVFGHVNEVGLPSLHRCGGNDCGVDALRFDLLHELMELLIVEKLLNARPGDAHKLVGNVRVETVAANVADAFVMVREDLFDLIRWHNLSVVGQEEVILHHAHVLIAGAELVFATLILESVRDNVVYQVCDAFSDELLSEAISVETLHQCARSGITMLYGGEKTCPRLVQRREFGPLGSHGGSGEADVWRKGWSKTMRPGLS